MDIRFISTLTPDDEARIAAALCAAAGPLLARFAIAYTIRIETTDGRSFHQQSVETALAQPRIFEGSRDTRA